MSGSQLTRVQEDLANPSSWVPVVDLAVAHVLAPVLGSDVSIFEGGSSSLQGPRARQKPRQRLSMMWTGQRKYLGRLHVGLSRARPAQAALAMLALVDDVMRTRVTLVAVPHDDVRV